MSESIVKDFIRIKTYTLLINIYIYIYIYKTRTHARTHAGTHRHTQTHTDTHTDTHSFLVISYYHFFISFPIHIYLRCKISQHFESCKIITML